MNRRGRISPERLQELLRSAAPPPSRNPEPDATFDSVPIEEVYRDTNLRPVSGNEKKSDEYFNAIKFFTFAVSFDSTDGSQQVLAHNSRRQFLSIDNQSADKDVYVNFGGDAGLNQGILVPPRSHRTYDQKVPYNSVHIFVSDTAKQNVVIVEGSPVLEGVA